jgi:hypothetical protein
MPDYFTLAELRALPDMNDSARYTDARVESAAAYIVSVIERVVRASFVARTVTDEVHDGGTYDIVLRNSHVLSATSATVGGVAVTNTLSVLGGVLQQYAPGATSPTLWTAGSRNVKVTYEAGYSVVPPADIKEAALQGTRARLLSKDSQASIDDRRTSMTTELGTVQYVIAGENRPTGYPEVDAVILGWRDTLNTFGFA